MAGGNGDMYLGFFVFKFNTFAVHDVKQHLERDDNI